MTKIIYYVHGTTYDNLEHKSTGWLQGELSPKGIEQTKDLKEKIEKEKDGNARAELEKALDEAIKSKFAYISYSNLSI